MLVLSANYYRSDELWLNVVFEDGTAAEIQIDDDGDHDFDEEASYMMAYAYVENADGTYDVSSKAPIGSRDGSLIRRDTVEWGVGNYLTIVSDTAVWDVTDVTRADEEVASGSFTYNDKNAVVVPGGSRGENVRTAWVWDKDVDDTPSHVSGVYEPNLYDVTGNVITIRKYVFDDLSSRDVSKLIGDEMEGMDIERVSIRSGTAPYAYEVTIEETDGYSSIYDVLIEDVRRITYNDRDYFLAEDESIDVNSPVVLSVSTTGGVTSYADASARVSSPSTGKYIYTLDAPVAVGSRTDIVIVDGWKLGGNIDIAKNKGNAVEVTTGNWYLPAGEHFTIGSTSAGKTITVTYDGEVETFHTDATTKTFDFEMPAADIKMEIESTPVTVTLKGVVGTVGTDNGEYSIYVPATAESGKRVRVEITVEEAPQVATTLTLTYGSTPTTKTIDLDAYTGEGAEPLAIYVTVTEDTTFTLTAADK